MHTCSVNLKYFYKKTEKLYTAYFLVINAHKWKNKQGSAELQYFLYTEKLQAGHIKI